VIDLPESGPESREAIYDMVKSLLLMVNHADSLPVHLSLFFERF
jgi:hypothetical protein